MYIYQKDYIVGSDIIRMIKSLFGSQLKLLLWSISELLPLLKVSFLSITKDNPTLILVLPAKLYFST